MFKFNFNIQNENNEQKKESKTTEKNKTEKSDVEWYECEEIDINQNKFFDNIGLYKLNSSVIEIANKKIKHVNYEKQLKCLKESVKDIKNADINHSDLIPAVYEGGAKIWECTEDLIHYMTNEKIYENLNEKIILDLGCGAGLLGILAMLHGAEVHFQDYNKDVIEIITIPNYLINDQNNSNSIINSKFYCGDWSKYIEKTYSLNKFDLILTSETIYNQSNQQKLLNVFKKKLKQNGTVLLAAKTYYFGVGGGLRQFEALIDEDQTFKSKIVWKSNEGVCREILELKFKNVL